MSKKESAPHTSVMVEECLEYFEPVRLRVFFDGTLGAGGHARALMEAHSEIQTYIGCDADPEALEIARKNLMPWQDKMKTVHANFADLDRILSKMKIKQVNGFFLI